MATSIPDQPTFVTPSERDVWQRVRAQLGDDCILLANYRLSDRDKDHEADLVVLMPGSGIVIVEVKGSHVWVEPDGQWMIERGGAKPIDPVRQSREALYAIRHYVETDPRLGVSDADPVGSSRRPGPEGAGRRLRHPGMPALDGLRQA